MRRLLVLLLVVALAGCATTGRETVLLPPLDSWDQRTLVLGGLTDWELRGRIGVKAGDEGFNGKIRWIQHGQGFTVTVGGPVGIGTVRIESDGGQATLTDKDGVETALVDAEQELRYRYGWTLPVGSLRYWALGVPAPSAPALTEFGEAGQLARLRQAGWVVQYTRYGEGGGQPMPGRLTITSADTRVRLVVDSWYFFK